MAVVVYLDEAVLAGRRVEQAAEVDGVEVGVVEGEIEGVPVGGVVELVEDGPLGEQRRTLSRGECQEDGHGVTARRGKPDRPDLDVRLRILKREDTQTHRAGLPARRLPSDRRLVGFLGLAPRGDLATASERKGRGRAVRVDDLVLAHAISRPRPGTAVKEVDRRALPAHGDLDRRGKFRPSLSSQSDARLALVLARSNHLKGHTAEHNIACGQVLRLVGHLAGKASVRDGREVDGLEIARQLGACGHSDVVEPGGAEAIGKPQIDRGSVGAHRRLDGNRDLPPIAGAGYRLGGAFGQPPVVAPPGDAGRGTAGDTLGLDPRLQRVGRPGRDGPSLRGYPASCGLVPLPAGRIPRIADPETAPARVGHRLVPGQFGRGAEGV